MRHQDEAVAAMEPEAVAAMEPEAVAAMRARMMTVEGFRLRVVDTGSGPAVLILNGSGANLEMLAPLVARLSRINRVIAFDAPGMGHSGRRILPVSIPRHAAIAVGLLDELGVEEADVIGYSFGGAVAQQLALCHPQRVSALALVAAVYGVGAVPTDPVAFVASLAHMLRLPGLDHVAGWWAFGGRAGREPEAYREFARLSADAPPDLISYLGQGIAISLWTSLPFLWAIRVPTLVVTGGHDRTVVPLNALVLAGLIPGAWLEVLPTAGHLLVIDEADEVAEVLEAFLLSPKTFALA